MTSLRLLSTPSIMKLLLRGRWPPTEGPVPTPMPPELATPAPSSDRLSTPPQVIRRGRESPPPCGPRSCSHTCAVVVSMYVEASMTSIAVETVPTSILMLAVVALLSSTARSFSEVVVNPVAVAVTRIGPPGCC